MNACGWTFEEKFRVWQDVDRFLARCVSLPVTYNPKIAADTKELFKFIEQLKNLEDAGDLSTLERKFVHLPTGEIVYTYLLEYPPSPWRSYYQFVPGHPKNVICLGVFHKDQDLAKIRYNEWPNFWDFL